LGAIGVCRKARRFPDYGHRQTKTEDGKRSLDCGKDSKQAVCLNSKKPDIERNKNDSNSGGYEPSYKVCCEIAFDLTHLLLWVENPKYIERHAKKFFVFRDPTSGRD
jgi:hypothetical protein